MKHLYNITYRQYDWSTQSQEASIVASTPEKALEQFRAYSRKRNGRSTTATVLNILQGQEIHGIN